MSAKASRAFERKVCNVPAGSLEKDPATRAYVNVWCVACEQHCPAQGRLRQTLRGQNEFFYIVVRDYRHNVSVDKVYGQRVPKFQ